MEFRNSYGLSRNNCYRVCCVTPSPQPLSPSGRVEEEMKNPLLHPVPSLRLPIPRPALPEDHPLSPAAKIAEP